MEQTGLEEKGMTWPIINDCQSYERAETKIFTWYVKHKIETSEGESWWQQRLQSPPVTRKYVEARFVLTSKITEEKTNRFNRMKREGADVAQGPSWS
jgi:hypothetical protein